MSWGDTRRQRCSYLIEGQAKQEQTRTVVEPEKKAKAISRAMYIASSLSKWQQDVAFPPLHLRAVNSCAAGLSWIWPSGLLTCAGPSAGAGRVAFAAGFQPGEEVKVEVAPRVTGRAAVDFGLAVEVHEAVRLEVPITLAVV